MDRLTALLERISRVLQNDGNLNGLRSVQWEALRFLKRANRFSRTPSALTSFLGTTKGTVSQTIGTLEKRGLLTRSTSTADRRAVYLELTDQGEKLLQSDPIEGLNKVILSLTEEARASLESGLETVLVSALQARNGALFGTCRTCNYFRKDQLGSGAHQCGLLNQPLSEHDASLICVEHEEIQSTRLP